MMPQEPVRDIMRRTIANLEFVEAYATLNGPYRTTQLLNSLLGALAYPWEQFYDHPAMKLSVAEAIEQGWPKVNKERAGDLEPDHLSDLVRLLRNGIAHGNVAFRPGPNGEVAGLRIWNESRGKRNWGTALSTEALRSFLFCFAKLAEQLCEEEIRRRRRRA
jgi:hypothetical protein